MLRRLCLALAFVALTVAPTMAQSSAPSPKHMTVIFENPEVRVIRVKIAADDKTEPHELRDAVAISLKDYEVKFTTSDGASHEAVRKTGEPVWVPASSRVVEVGDNPAEAIIVEIKCSAPSGTSSK